MDNQPVNAGHGRPGALDGDPVNQANTLADGRSISDLTKNKGKEKDDAAYLDEKARIEAKEEEPTEEDFEKFNLDAVDED